MKVSSFFGNLFERSLRSLTMTETQNNSVGTGRKEYSNFLAQSLFGCKHFANDKSENFYQESSLILASQNVMPDGLSLFSRRRQK